MHLESIGFGKGGAGKRLRWLAALALSALLWNCTTTPGMFTLRFGWAGGVVPSGLPAKMFLYSFITSAAGVQVATSGPNLYSSGEQLKFANVPNGNGLVVTIELLDSNGSAANVIAYGQSAPFSLEPGKNVEVNVALQLHPVTAVPSTGGIQVNGLMDGEIGSPIVSLELYVDASAVGATISNLPAFEEGDSTKVLSALTPDPNAVPAPSQGFKAYRYDGWNLETTGVPACTTLCQRSVYVFFTDKNQIKSATSSTTITLNRQLPTLSTHVTASSTPSTPPIGGVGVTLTIVATPSEPLGGSDAGVPDITPHVYTLSDTTQAHELVGFLGNPLANTEYTYEHAIGTAVAPNIQQSAVRKCGTP